MPGDPYRYFRVEARELVDQLGRGLLDIEKLGASADQVGQLLRLAHTLKGAARVVRQPAIAEHAHAIEGILEPFRGAAGNLPADVVNEMLKRVDQIAGGVAALSVPDEAKPVAPGPAKAENVLPRVEDNFRTVRTEVEEIDDVVDGVAEVFATLKSVRDTAGALERAGHLAELVTAQLSARGKGAGAPESLARSDRIRALAEELRGIIGTLERDLGPACDRMARELHQVRDVAEQLRLVPAGTLFTSLERAARDAALVLGKSVTFAAQGAEVRLDAHVLRTVQEALMQMIRNAVAHGIEDSKARSAAGKPAAGRVFLSVGRHGRRIVFRCEDDGRGVDIDAVRAAARRRNLPAADIERLDAGGLVRLLMQSGLSTSASVTEVSGRGIGMDIVREAVDRLGGSVLVRTAPGRGTTFELTVPLSLASVETLVVESGGAAVTIPLDSVRHTERISPAHVSRSARGEAITFEGNAIPFVPLARILKSATTQRNGLGMSAVVVSSASGLAAIGVDRLVGTASVVLHALPEFAPAEQFVAGASLDAEGNPQLVLDADGLVAAAVEGSAAEAEATQAQPVLVIDDSLTTRMLEQSILESAGYQVDVAVSAEEALDRARHQQYSLFLVDVEMPGMDGFTFIERIRADAGLRHVPAILVTSLSSEGDMKRGEAVGAQGYMIKSEFDQAQLLGLIRRLVTQ